MSGPFKIKFNVEVGLGKDTGVECRLVTEFPYLPRKGDMIVVAPGDDFREVNQIYYSAKDGFEVFLEFDEASREGLKQMKKVGWKELS